jgi:hypothetical protein
MAIRFEDNLRTLAENLLTLEVNTILKPEITGEKMPPPEAAVADLATLYGDALEAIARAEQPQQATPRASAETFDDMVVRADAMLSEPAIAGNQTETLTVRRIRDSCRKVSGLLNAEKARREVTGQSGGSRETEHGHALELLPDELVLLRKLWDIGLEQIAFQTVIQIDGDVITRIRSELAESNAQNQRLLEIHNGAVTTSIEFWKGLVELLGSFLKGVTELIRGR